MIDWHHLNIRTNKAKYLQKYVNLSVKINNITRHPVAGTV